MGIVRGVISVEDWADIRRLHRLRGICHQIQWPNLVIDRLSNVVPRFRYYAKEMFARSRPQIGGH